MYDILERKMLLQSKLGNRGALLLLLFLSYFTNATRHRKLRQKLSIAISNGNVKKSNFASEMPRWNDSTRVFWKYFLLPPLSI